MTRAEPPSADELELSLFGPGVGECAVVHLCNNDWMIVDSCRATRKSRPIAIEYLESLSVDVSRAVKHVIVTHWHNDHIRGISEVVRCAANAKVTCSLALNHAQFLELLLIGGAMPPLVRGDNGSEEFRDMLGVLKERKSLNPQFSPHGIHGPDHWVSDTKPIYRGPESFGVNVHTLSPSSQACTAAVNSFANLIPLANSPMNPIPNVAPNKTSVVVQVSTAAVSFLLGADLENSPYSDMGWNAILGDTTRPAIKSLSYKVAHHGSPNADSDGVWGSMLEGGCHAIIAPYAACKTPRPSDDDVARIKGRGAKVYCTSWPSSRQPPRRKSVDSILATTAKRRWTTPKLPGQVRLRVHCAGNASGASVDLFDGAAEL